MTSSSKPQRTCSVCRVKSDKDDLIRVVRSPDGRPVVDVSKKLPGRGLYICPDEECIKRARKSGLLAGADEQFWSDLTELAHSHPVNNSLKIRSTLGLARKSGTLLIGTDNIEREHKKVLVMTASDCSENVKSFADRFESVKLDLTCEELSEAIGTTGRVQIVGLPVNSGFAKKIREREQPFE